MLWKPIAAFVFIALNLPALGVESTTAFVPLMIGRVQTAMREALHTVRTDLKTNKGAARRLRRPL